MSGPVSCTIGITSIGSGVGQSIVDSCRLSRVPMRLVGLGCNPFAFGGFDCDIRDTLPGIYDPGYIDALHRKCLEHGISIVIPGLDEELLPLARHRDRFLADGIDVIVPGEGLLDLCRDKERMSRDLAKHSSAFVKTMDLARLHEMAGRGALQFPLIAKPRSGFASRGILVINGPADFPRITPDHIVQTVAVPRTGDIHRDPFLEGLRRGNIPQIGEVSAQIVIGRDGREIGRMATCNKLVNGVPIEAVPVEIPEVWTEIDRLLPHFIALGLRGPLNIQGRITDDGPRFFEMNARFTGITGLRAMMGFNEVEAVILDALGRLPEDRRLAHNPRRIGMRQVANRVVDVGFDASLARAVAATGFHPGQSTGRRVLITGANSYLGRATIDALLSTPGVSGVTALVRNLSRFSDGSEPALPVGLIVHDVGDLWNGILNLGNFDVLVHLASGRPVHSADTLSDSLRFTRDLMTLAASHHLPGIIHASSQSVYGRSRPPMWHEAMPPAPETLYAQAKWTSELMAAMPRQINHITATTSLRMARLIGLGAGIRWVELPHRFMRQAVTGERITIQDGQQMLDYLHVRDAAWLVARLCVRPFDEWPAVVNAGSGAPISLLDFSELVNRVTRDILGRDAVMEVIPASVDLKMGMAIELARERLDWTPSIDLETTLREIACHLLEGGTTQAYPEAGKQ